MGATSLGDSNWEAGDGFGIESIVAEGFAGPVRTKLIQ